MNKPIFAKRSKLQQDHGNMMQHIEAEDMFSAVLKEWTAELNGGREKNKKERQQNAVCFIQCKTLLAEAVGKEKENDTKYADDMVSRS